MIEPTGTNKLPKSAPVCKSNNFKAACLTTNNNDQPEMALPVGRLLGKVPLQGTKQSTVQATALGSIFPESGTEDRYAIIVNGKTIVSFRADVVKTFDEGRLRNIRDTGHVKDYPAARRNNDDEGYVFIDNVYVSEQHADEYPNLDETLIQMMVEVSLNNGCNGKVRLALDRSHVAYYSNGFKACGEQKEIHNRICEESLNHFRRTGELKSTDKSIGRIVMDFTENGDYISRASSNPFLTEYNAAIDNIASGNSSGFQFPTTLTTASLVANTSAASIYAKVMPLDDVRNVLNDSNF